MNRRPCRLQLAKHAAALTATAFLTACVTDRVTGEKRFAVVQWSVAQEQAIGDQAAPNFEQQFGGAMPDAAAQLYLASVVKEMAGHSVRKDDFSYQFEVLDSSEPNAFALPGGYVYITRGLMENLESEGEFVAVLGHELGHVEHQHSMLQQNKAIAASVLVGAVGIGEELLKKDPDQPNNVTALVGAAAPLALLHFSREQESEADVRGLYFAHAMGYDPREMKKTFEYFARLEAAAGSSTPSFLRDHPTNETRLGDIDTEIAAKYGEVLAKKPAQFRAAPGPNDRFVQIVTAMKKRAPAHQKADEAQALLAKGGDDPAALAKAKKLADEACAALPDDPQFHCLAGEIAFTQQKPGEKSAKGDRGRAEFEKARQLQQKATPTKELWKPAFYLGVLDLDAGKGASAAKSLRRASELFPDNPVAAYYLGRAEELNGDKQAAATAYARAAELAPAESELHQKAAERAKVVQGLTPAAPAKQGGHR